MADDSLTLRVAKAIEGPWDPQGFYVNDPKKLAELREYRWNMLSSQDKGVRKQEALSAIRVIDEHSKK